VEKCTNPTTNGCFVDGMIESKGKDLVGCEIDRSIKVTAQRVVVIGEIKSESL
jgi:hypothetical protein